MKYIGVRSCNCDPKEDNYWGSSKYIPKDVKTTHKKRILKIHATRLDAVNHEIFLHNKYDVAVNKEFYNRSKQTSTKFDTTGIPHSCTEEARRKLSISKKGKKRPPEVVEAMRQRMLGTKQSPETCKKRSETAKKNNKMQGTNASAFRPWYISTETVTYIFYNVTKSDQSILDGHYKKYYADLQKCIRKNGNVIVSKKYGPILDMDFIPT
jgi:hypothetical protein